VGRLEQAVEVADPFVRAGVSEEIRRDGIGVELVAAHDPEEVQHPLGVVSGVGKVGHADAVGFLFVLAAVAEVHAGPGGDGKARHGGGQIAAAAEKCAGQHCGNRRNADFLRLGDDIGDMPRVDMGDFMGKHARQLALVLDERDQPPVEIDVAAWRREGVYGAAVDDAEAELKDGNGALFDDPVADVGDVAFRSRIVDEQLVRFEFFVKFLA